mmetsp:Transcript_8275/g.11462  ORF Transcript_8275/g.11462 Transcript_8275/m.11462 type:complete len:124 (-) Transcript_8275:116-487(-)
MVYQDYELIATKRVGHSRMKGFLLLRRQFEAAGGINTLFMMTFCGVGGSVFGLRSTTPLVRPLASTAGLASLARNTMTAGGPALVGLAMGICYFGNPSELKNLLWNARTYSREIRAVQKEHYY